jgi:BirA family biotin operon repressor/biotin-[acetyl-CoA-carboxylase] ligase
MNIDDALRDFLAALMREGRAPLGDWPDALGHPHELGLVTTADHAILDQDVEFLSDADVARNLTSFAADWLKALEVHSVIGSTNDRLMAEAEGSVDGLVCLAEVQTKGRGRRGKSWLSPFATNVALSAGIGLRQSPHQLGGLSLVIGLAVIDCLDGLGVRDAALKWPNDVLLGGRKLGGILIEIKSTPAAGRPFTEAVIGIGMNVSMPSNLRVGIDQAVTDLAGEGYTISRNQLVAGLISSVLDHVRDFERTGFAGMRQRFDEHHWLHGQLCQVSQGSTVTVGRVQGVTDTGELELLTESGSQRFGAGEVSLRRRL